MCFGLVDDVEVLGPKTPETRLVVEVKVIE